VEPTWAAPIGRNGDTSVTASTGGDIQASCAGVSGKTPPRILPTSNGKPASKLCRRRKKAALIFGQAMGRR
jgi:hypothetical protein